MKREPGFYWVKCREWQVGFWDGYHWNLGALCWYSDKHFDAIHEPRLIPPENADSRPE